MSEQKTANRKKLVEKLRELVGKKIVINNVYEGTLEDVFGEMLFIRLGDGSLMAVTRRSISTIKVVEQ